jgi:sortase (surface protein transpeptidase)
VSIAMRRALVAALAICLAATGSGMIAWQIFDAHAPVRSAAMVAPLVTRAAPSSLPAEPKTSQRAAPTSAAAPVEVRIPALDVAGRPVPLGTNADGSMEVPADGGTIGWYANGPAPGAVGPAVLAAHVTYNGARGAFYGLDRMRRGQKVEVARADGTTAVFRVTKVAQYAKDAFPTVEVYANVDHPGLRLITCAGDFDPQRHHYPDNIVVYGELDSVQAARQG